MDISNQEKQYGESFSDFFARTSFRTNQTRQKALLSNSLATLLLSHRQINNKTRHLFTILLVVYFMLQRVDARIKKRRSDLTASRGELIEVNVESAFEPIIQETGVPHISHLTR